MDPDDSFIIAFYVLYLANTLLETVEKMNIETEITWA